MNGEHAAMRAKTRAKLPGWTPFEWQVIGEGAGILLTGGVSRTLKSGPRKGKPTWDPPHEQVFVSAAEIIAFERRYERKTGKCAMCDGTGQVWAGYKVGEGHRYRPCSRKGCEGGTLAVTA